MVILARWAWYRWVLRRAVGLLCAVRRFARALGNYVPRLIAAATPNLGIWLLGGSLSGSCQLLVLLLCLPLVIHEVGDNIQVRLLLGFELLRHGDVPIQAGLAGQLAYESLECGGVVEDLQLVHVGQVAVDCAPTSMKLLKLGSLGGGVLGVLEGMEVGHTFGGQLTVLPVLIV